MNSNMRAGIYLERNNEESPYVIKRTEDLLLYKSENVFINKLFTDQTFTVGVSIMNDEDVKYEVKCKILNHLYFKTNIYTIYVNILERLFNKIYFKARFLSYDEGIYTIDIIYNNVKLTMDNTKEFLEMLVQEN